MHIHNLQDAKTNLSRLINMALAGDEVVIARRDQPLVKLTPIQADTSPRVGGQWAGKVVIPSDQELAKIDKEIEESFYASNVFPDGEV